MKVMYNIMSFTVLSCTVQHLLCDSFDELFFPSMTLLSTALRIMLLVLFFDVVLPAFCSVLNS